MTITDKFVWSYGNLIVLNDVLVEKYSPGQPRDNRGRWIVEEASYKYGSTQINLTGRVASKLLAYGAAIPNEDLAADGREEQAHVTVKYGLDCSSEEALSILEEICSETLPFKMYFGQTSLFDTDPDYDVLKVSVYSPELNLLNARLGAALPFKTTHSVYQPHTTIAYLKKGRGVAYNGKAVISGDVYECKTIVLCDRDGEQHELTFGLVEKYSPAQPRNQRGRWSAGGIVTTTTDEIKKHDPDNTMAKALGMSEPSKVPKPKLPEPQAYTPDNPPRVGDRILYQPPDKYSSSYGYKPQKPIVAVLSSAPGDDKYTWVGAWAYAGPGKAMKFITMRPRRFDDGMVKLLERGYGLSVHERMSGEHPVSTMKGAPAVVRRDVKAYRKAILAIGKTPDIPRTIPPTTISGKGYTALQGAASAHLYKGLNVDAKQDGRQVFGYEARSDVKAQVARSVAERAIKDNPNTFARAYDKWAASDTKLRPYTVPTRADIRNAARLAASDANYEPLVRIANVVSRDAEKVVRGFSATLKDPKYKTPEKAQAAAEKYLYARAASHTVSEMVGAWAGGATSGTHPDLLALQKAIHQEFRLRPEAETIRLARLSPSERDAANKVYAQKGALYRIAVRAMYKETQEKLAADGVKEVTLKRGINYSENAIPEWMKGGVDTGKERKLVSNPASSWTSSAAIANEASGWGGGGGGKAILTATIPRERILSTARTGFGCLDEHEFVMLDTPGTVTVSKKA